jgi:hypothetical protein
VNSLSDIVAMAKKTPGGLTVGTPPPPTLNYLGAELFKSLTGAEVTIVTYKGTGPLTNDLVGGHVMVAFNTLPPAISNIQAGKIKAIAVCAPTRLAALPDVPTNGERASSACWLLAPFCRADRAEQCRLSGVTGLALAISVPAGETRVLKYLQEWMPYGLFVPDVP